MMVGRGYAIRICGPKVYRFEGVEFEVHSWFGPCPLTPDGEPVECVPEDFWPLWERFKALPVADQERFCSQ